MKLSTKCRYGIRAIIEIAENYGKGPVKRKTIVKNQNIPDSYLENILILLRNKGIISTIRGANGGYILNNAPQEVDLLEVVNALEGTLSPVICLENNSFCDKFEECSIVGVWKELRQIQEDFLHGISIQSLIDKEK